MRIPIRGADSVKAAARLVARHADGVPLFAAREALARAAGYRDWHELVSEAVHSGVPCDATMEFGHALRLISATADMLGVDDGVMQFCLAKSRLFGVYNLEDNLKLRTQVWRTRHFAEQGRLVPGSIVKVKGFKEPAYLKSSGGLARVIWSEAFGTCVDEEIITPRTPIDDFVPHRLWLPYGVWKTRDGSRVPFSRDYKPLWRIGENATERLDPWLWIDDIEEEHHFCSAVRGADWYSSAVRSRATQFLLDNRIFELPRLVDAMPYLFLPQIESFSSAVKAMKREVESAKGNASEVANAVQSVLLP